MFSDILYYIKQFKLTNLVSNTTSDIHRFRERFKNNSFKANFVKLNLNRDAFFHITCNVAQRQPKFV